MRKNKCYLSMILVMALFTGLFSGSVSMAAKKVKLSDKKLTVTVGKTKTLKLKNNKKKVKWTVIAGKKYVKLKSPKRTGIKIVGKKAGKAKIQAKTGKKKYICKVTVKKKKVSSVHKDEQDKKPVRTPSASPDPVPTPKPAAPDAQGEVVALSLSASRELFFQEGEDEQFPEKYLSTWLRDNGLSLTIQIIYNNSVRTITTTLCENSKDVIPQGMTIGCKDREITVQYKGKNASLKIDYKKEQKEGEYLYITNGTVSHITGYTGKNEGSVVIPDTIGDVPVTDLVGWDASLADWDVAISELTLPKQLHNPEDVWRPWQEWSLKAFHTKEGAKNLKAVDGVLFDTALHTLICYPKGKEDESYRVPDDVTAVREGAFYGNTYLKNLDLPVSLSAYGNEFVTYSDIDAMCFSIPNLEEITVADQNPYLTSVDGVLYDKKKEILRYCPPKRKKQTLEVPKGVQVIAHFAMEGVEVKELILPETLVAFEYQSLASGDPAPAHIYIRRNCQTEEEWQDLWYYGMNIMQKTEFHVKSQRMYDFLKTIWDGDFVFPDKISKEFDW